MKTIENISTIVRKDNILKPCSTMQVEYLEEKFGVSLPHEYKKFLIAMGKGAEAFMMGTSCFYEDIFYLKSGADELLLENKFRQLPNNAFVFWMHQGYQFAFFLLTDGDNPPVYFYHEGKDQQDFILLEPSFTDFLYEELKSSGIVLSDKKDDFL